MCMNRIILKEMINQKQISNEQKIPQFWQWKSEERYYTIRLQRDLFGEWSLIKSWGGLRNKLGSYSIEICETYESAMETIRKTDLKRKKRHYNLLS